MSDRILILGAGVCGLAAAHRLLERDPSLEVTILEREERPGGLARSLTVNGQVTDLGPHRIFTELPDVQEFLQDLAGDQLKSVKRKSRMWLKGGWIEYPPKPVEVTARLGLGTVAGAGFSYAGEKLNQLMNARGEGGESFESLMRQGFGPELYRILVEPYARKVWKISPKQMHADIARVRVSAGGLDQIIKKLIVGEPKDKITAVKKFYYIAGGVEKLVMKLRTAIEAAGAEFRLVRTVNGLRQFRTGHIQASAITPQGKEEVYHAESCISTIGLPDTLDMLLPQIPDEALEKAKRELRYITNILVCVVANRPKITDSQWLYFPEKDTIFNRGYEPGNFHESMTSGGQSMIVMEITCHPGDKTDQRSDRELTNATIRGLERVGLLSREEIAATHVHRIPRTYPLYDLEYRERLSKIWRYLDQFPQLLSSGRQGLFLHNNMDHSMHMGFRAAEQVLSKADNPAKEFYSEIRRFQEFRIVD